VTDQHGGRDSSEFTLDVNGDYQAPAITAPSTYAVIAGTGSTQNMTAAYDNTSDSLIWTFSGLPSFASYQVSDNGRHVSLNIDPSVSDIGRYVFTASVSNSEGTLSSQQEVNLSVRGKQVIYINFNDGTNSEGGNWNNTNTKYPDINDVFANMIDSSGDATAIGLKVITPWQQMGGGSNNSGTSTGNNSGVYPDNVLRSAYWTLHTASQSIQVYGLDTSESYDFTFFGSRVASDPRTTNYQIGSRTVSLNTGNNTSNTVTIDDVKPDQAGTVTLTLSAGSGYTYGYLNALVISGGLMPDKTSPVMPGNLTVHYDSITNRSILNWESGSDNTQGYEVYRRPEDSATYIKVAQIEATSKTFVDSLVVGATTYLYEVRAFNSNGYSPFTEPVQITTSDAPPVITPIDNMILIQGTVDTIMVSASATPGHTLTIRANELPPFGQFTYNGNGKGHIIFNSNGVAEGTYEAVITATDEKGQSDSTEFTIKVIKGSVSVVEVNFNGSMNVAAPWNNTAVSNPGNTTSLANLLDTAGVSTSISLNLQESWSGSNANGAITGDNSGIYPDSVMQTSYWDGTGVDKHLVLSGLSSVKRYTISLFSSHSGAGNYTTVFSIGSRKDSLNASNNTSDIVVFNDLTPDQQGKITMTMNRGVGSDYAYLNAMVINAHDSVVVLPPTDLAASASNSEITLKWSNASANLSKTQIWRAGAANGDYLLVDSVQGDIEQYKDDDVAPNTRYFYKLRSIRDNTVSEYSKIASATTSLYYIYVNFSDDNRAPMPWNDINSVPLQGDIFDLYDATGGNTGVTLEDMGGFTAVNHSGTSTGDNSGVYPDDVMDRSYYVDGIDTGRLTLRGLNLSMAYSLTFFAGRTGTGDRTTTYVIGNNVVSLNAAGNTTQTVTINDVMPNSDGEINIGVVAGGSSPYAYVGALVIQARNNYDDSGNIIYNPMLYMLNGRQSGDAAQRLMMSKDIDNHNLSSEMLKAYPNPFDRYVNIRLNWADNEKLDFRLLSIDGKSVDYQSIPVANGLNNITYRPLKNLVPGVYILTIRSQSSGKTITVKLIRR